MKLTRSVGYAVGVLLRVASHPRGESMTATEISRDCEFPPRFLYRILRKLVDAGLLRGVSGPRGGYSLARGAKRIRLYDVIVAIEGNEQLSPLEAVHPQHRAAVRRINHLMREQTRQFQQTLRRVTLDDLLPSHSRARTGRGKQPRSHG